MTNRWLPTAADDATAARIRSVYQEIADHLGDAAPDPDEQVTVSITAAGAIRCKSGTCRLESLHPVQLPP